MTNKQSQRFQLLRADRRNPSAKLIGPRNKKARKRVSRENHSSTVPNYKLALLIKIVTENLNYAQVDTLGSLFVWTPLSTAHWETDATRYQIFGTLYQGASVSRTELVSWTNTPMLSGT
jgi:hypothetical protein